MDSMQTELDTLRDLLKTDGYSLDANTLLGVCATIPSFEQDFIKVDFIKSIAWRCFCRRRFECIDFSCYNKLM